MSLETTLICFAVLLVAVFYELSLQAPRSHKAVVQKDINPDPGSEHRPA